MDCTGPSLPVKRPAHWVRRSVLHSRGAGYHGYRFRILPDKNGFAMVAWPVNYGQTGVMSFVINQDDAVYQADLGNDSAQKAQALSEYQQDKTWQPVTP